MRFILAIALLLRLLAGVILPVADLPDQREYLSLGRNLLSDHSLHFYDPRFGQDVYAYRMPGYPVMVAACGGSVRVIRFLQALLDTSTVAAVYLIAKRLITPSAGTPGDGADSRIAVHSKVPTENGPKAAALLLAVNPFYIYFSTLALSETAFCCVLTWGIYCSLRRSWVGVAVLVASGFFRPVGFFLAPFLVLGFHRSVSRAVATVGLIFVSLLPWAARNRHVLGETVWTTTNAGVTLWDGFHDGATGASDQRLLAERAPLRSIGEVARSRLLAEAATRWIRLHPLMACRLGFAKIFRGWSPVPLSAEFGKPTYRLAAGLYCVPVGLFCAAGFYSRRWRWRAKLPCFLPAVLVTGVQVLSVGSIRYRLPAEPMLLVSAGVGFCLFEGLAPHRAVARRFEA